MVKRQLETETKQIVNPRGKKHSQLVYSHPLGVKPSGNVLIYGDNAPGNGLGPFRRLPDHVLMELIQVLDNPCDLLALSHTSREFYAFCWFDDLWKAMVYKHKPAPRKWHGSWRKTFWGQDWEALVQARDTVFSDYLYRPFQCSQIDYEHFISNLDDPACQIPTIASLSTADYETKYYKRPFILQHSNVIAPWTRGDLVKRFGSQQFRQEYMDWTLEVYSQYMDANNDESPLYLFDCSDVVQHELSSEFSVPLPHILSSQHDFFELLSDVGRDHQWLIMGPRNSGSTFHKDPNGTCAWNSVVTGRKYWIMFPPSQPPPGVHTDDAEDEVTAPFSIAEWFLSGYYDEARSQPGFVHGVCRPGQTMYVPSGWWHLVVNLDESIAMTGNLVPKVGLATVLHFLKTRPQQISGFRRNDVDIYALFVERLEKCHPELYDVVAEEVRRLENPRSKWQALTENAAGFAFSFD